MTEETPVAPEIRIVGGSPDDSEVAAITAVLSAALDELARAHRLRDASSIDGWERGRRSMREPLVKGSWGSWK